MAKRAISSRRLINFVFFVSKYQHQQQGSAAERSEAEQAWRRGWLFFFFFFFSLVYPLCIYVMGGEAGRLAGLLFAALTGVGLIWLYNVHYTYFPSFKTFLDFIFFQV